MKYLSFVSRLILGGVFIYSGYGKLMAPAANFAAVIETYQVLHPPVIEWVAFVFPWLELCFGTFLLLGFCTKFSSFAIGLFLSIFIGLLLRSVLGYFPITECGCFGTGIVLTPKQALTVDSVLFVLALISFSKPSKWLSLDKRLGG